jgi:HAMP domain-containing protein
LEDKRQKRLINGICLIVFMALLACFGLIYYLKESNTQLTKKLEILTSELYELNNDIDSANQRIDEVESTVDHLDRMVNEIEYF